MINETVREVPIFPLFVHLSLLVGTISFVEVFAEGRGIASAEVELPLLQEC